MNIALIGYGFMGRAHSNAFLQAPRFFETRIRPRLKVVCGRDRARVDQMAAQWGWEETASDWRAVIDRKDIDLVDIAAPNHLHAEIAIAAAQAGKMVLCEKPLANSAEDAERMVEAARPVRNGVWFNYRRVPAVAQARQWIKEGRLGRVFHYRGQYLQGWGIDPTRRPGWKLNRAEAGSGVIGDLLSHSLDLALFLNGPIADLQAWSASFVPGREVEDAAAVMARFQNGSLGTFEATRFATGYQNRNAFEIHGDKGMIGFDLEDMTRLRFFDATAPVDEQGIRNVPVAAPQFWKPGHAIGYEHTFIAAFADFLKAVETGERFRPDFEDGLEVQRLVDRVLVSAR
jgi:predicted dehydrogenase